MLKSVSRHFCFLWYYVVLLLLLSSIFCLTKNQTPNQINRPIHVGEMVKNSQKMGIYAILGHFGTPKLTLKGTQVGGMYVPMFKLDNKPLTKSIGLFL
jgi:hypothetical protein